MRSPGSEMLLSLYPQRSPGIDDRVSCIAFGQAADDEIAPRSIALLVATDRSIYPGGESSGQAPRVRRREMVAQD